MKFDVLRPSGVDLVSALLDGIRELGGNVVDYGK